LEKQRLAFEMQKYEEEKAERLRIEAKADAERLRQEEKAEAERIRIRKKNNLPGKGTRMHVTAQIARALQLNTNCMGSLL